MSNRGTSETEEAPRRFESDEERYRFILDGQEHCDHFLTSLAQPGGKRVLVAGAGAGTEMLWCLRRGAREVVGIDIAPQEPNSLRRACQDLGIQAPFSLRQLAIEDLGALDDRFDLVLSNNVVEHVRDLATTFKACAGALVEGTGRLAVFTAPLYYSSAGGHLPCEPWEHLWSEPETLRARLLSEGSLPSWHALHEIGMSDYLDREISLNRARFSDLLAALAHSGLILLHVHVRRDRHLAELPAFLPRLRARLAPQRVPTCDFAIEGLGLELAAVAPGAPTGALETSAEVAEWRARVRLEAELRDLHAGEVRHLRAELDRALEVLRSVERSTSFRLGRAVTAPARAVRRLFDAG